MIVGKALLALGTVQSAVAAVNYTSYQSLKFLSAVNDLDKLSYHVHELLGIEISSDRSGLTTVVPSTAVSVLEKLGFIAEEVDNNLEAQITAEGPLVSYYGGNDIQKRTLPDDKWFDAYHPYEDHIKFLRDLQAAFPSNSEIFTLEEKTWEGRSIEGIHLWGAGGKGSKPAAIWHGTIHAREWITTMAVEYAVLKLLEGYSTGSTKAILDNYDFYITPVANPDGLVFTQAADGDRLWRKNRQIFESRPAGDDLWPCWINHDDPAPEQGMGIDLNRNWPNQWDMGYGLCSWRETYKGRVAGDAPETRALLAQAEALHNILGPYAYKGGQAANYNYHIELMSEMGNAIKSSRGTQYSWGPTYWVYAVDGGLGMDHFTDVYNTTVAFALELPPVGRSSGGVGFLLPASEIKPVVKETWDGVKTLFDKMRLRP